MAFLGSSLNTAVSGTGANGSIPRDPATWALQDAQAAVQASYPTQYDQVAAQSVKDYVQGLHYQDARPWMGAGYDTAGNLADTSKTIIARQLAPVPEMFACLERRVEGACGIQAAISIKPAEPDGEENEQGEREPGKEQRAYAKQWRADLSAWIDRSGAWGGKDIRKPTGVRGMVALASQSQSGSACLRLFYNPAARTQTVTRRDGSVEQRIPKQADRRAALKHVHIVAPPPERCAVYIDPDTHEKTGVFLFSENQQECAEVWFARGDKTVLRRIVSASPGTPDSDPEQVFPWGGWIPIQQADIGCLLTDAVRRLQGAVDFGGTALVRLLQSMAWGQRTEIDAEDDGYWSTTPDAEIVNQRTRLNASEVLEYFKPLPAGLGPEIVRRLVGYEYSTGTTKDGPTFGRTSPSVHYHEPSDPEGLIKGIDAFTMLIRYACHQGHIRSGLLGSSAEASGEAYEQARAAFGADINGVGECTDGVFAPTLTTATIMADWLTGDDDPAVFADEWTVESQSHPNAGSPSTETQRSTLEMVDGELLSPDEGTARLNVQDVGAERARISQSRSLDRVTKLVAAAASAASAGLNVRKVLLEAGVSEKEADEWVQSDGLPNVEQ